MQNSLNIKNSAVQLIQNESAISPVYQKPKTTLFLKKPTDIQSGHTTILESQAPGNSGYLTS